MEDAPAPELVAEVPVAEVVAAVDAVVVPEAPAPEVVPAAEVVAAPAAASSEVAPAPSALPEEVAPPHRGPLDIKLPLPSAAQKNIKEMDNETFHLTEGKQAQVLTCLTAAFPGEQIQVSEDGKTILIGDEYKLSFLVQDDSPYVVIHSLNDKEDHTIVFNLNVTLFQILTQ